MADTNPAAVVSNYVTKNPLQELHRGEGACFKNRRRGTYGTYLGRSRQA